MTKGELETIRNVIARLEKQNCGCTPGFTHEEAVTELNAKGYECPSRLYLDTWVIGALRALLPETRNVELARDLSR